jgi:hypothetical protein
MESDAHNSCRVENALEISSLDLIKQADRQSHALNVCGESNKQLLFYFTIITKRIPNGWIGETGYYTAFHNNVPNYGIAA